MSGRVDPALVHWITQLQNLLSQSFTEQSAYDFKQGFVSLDGKNLFDEGSFEKIMKTCVGIANNSRNSRGYVIIGVADNKNTADRVAALFNISPRLYEGFYVTGVEHESAALGKSLDQLFQMIVDKTRNSQVSSDLKDYLVKNLKSVRYYEKTVYVFDVAAQRDPSSYADAYYVRHGAQLAAVEPKDLGDFFRRYLGA